MKQENWIYLLAFLCGVVIVNLFGVDTWANSSLLNRYNLAALSFQEIAYEKYFVQILLLRFRTITGLWVLSKILPKKIVIIGFTAFVSAMLGAIAAMAIMENGVWGVFFCMSALLPHGIFYVMAHMVWSGEKGSYILEENRKTNHLKMVLILMLVGIGCVCEAYICPILIKNVIKI